MLKRIQRFFSGAKWYQVVAWSILIAGTLLTFYLPDIWLLKFGENYLAHTMLTYFGIALFTLFANEERIAFVAFACCAIMCLELRTRAPFYAETSVENPTFTVANFNVANSDDDYVATCAAILESDADIISIQEVTPDWAMVLNQELHAKYPYDTTFVRIDFYGLAVYSKIPFNSIDTFHHKSFPNLVARFKPDSSQSSINLISSHTLPPVSMDAYKELEQHLLAVADKAGRFISPVIAVGDYNAVPWSSEITAFREKANLLDSRRENIPSSKHPVDHIFYSNEIECVEFKNIAGNLSDYLGIIGTYQFKSEDVEKRTQ